MVKKMERVIAETYKLGQGDRKAFRATKDVDLVFFGDPQVLEDDLDAAFDRDYSQFAFQRQQIEQMRGRQR